MGLAPIAVTAPTAGAEVHIFDHLSLHIAKEDRALLERVAEALERIANHFDLTRGSKAGFTTLYNNPEGKHESEVIYTDDLKQVLDEQRRLEYMERTGILLADWEEVPGPVDEKGEPFKS